MDYENILTVSLKEVFHNGWLEENEWMNKSFFSRSRIPIYTHIDRSEGVPKLLHKFVLCTL